ncbi:hypothetical protein CS542_07490 [Pedobacter sp. IW39]|nr:hypothetical protein CS542_07490 [Pedobacter sp. IW39]
MRGYSYRKRGYYFHADEDFREDWGKTSLRNHQRTTFEKEIPDILLPDLPESSWKKKTGNDTDKAMAKAGSSKPGKLKPEAETRQTENSGTSC